MAAATVKKTKKASRSKRKTNLLRIANAMNKMVVDANDREIMRRFKVLIDTSEEDVTKAEVDVILKNPESVTISNYHEAFQPYIKHYIFMLKRADR